MDARGERVFGPERGWLSFRSSIQPSIDARTVWASGNGVTWTWSRVGVFAHASEMPLPCGLRTGVRQGVRPGGRAEIRASFAMRDAPLSDSISMTESR